MSAEKKKHRMNKTELAKYRDMLLEKRRELIGDVSQLENQAQRNSGDVVSVDHMADHGSDSYEKDQTIGLIERESEALKAVNLALARIDDGTFGICPDCDEPIKSARLQALPYARLCLDCQTLKEQSAG